MTTPLSDGGRPHGSEETLNSRLPTPGRITKPLRDVTGRQIDLILFGVLFIFVVFYELQNLWGFISVLRVREVLYMYLTLRILTAYRVEFNLGVILLFLFFLYGSFVALHTWLGYGSEIAIKGFLRWINAALIAPIALVLIQDMAEARNFFYLWVTLVIFGAMAAPYQFFGGELDWLVRGYSSFRGGLIRFKTLLGEPNVAGMAGALVLGFALIAVRSTFVQAILVTLSFVMIIFSVSKAALGGVMIVVLFSFWHRYVSLRKTSVILAATVILGGILFFIAPDFVRGMKQMSDVSVRTFFGKTGKNAAEDIYDRVVIMTAQGIELAHRESDLPVLTVLGGGSFAIAGSAAVQVGSESAILPHNSFAEIYLVGGLVYLAIFVSLILRVYDNLRKCKANRVLNSARIMFICTIVFAFTYPIIYAPALGAVFWLIVGLSLGGCVKSSFDTGTRTATPIGRSSV